MKKIVTFKADNVNIMSGSNFYLIDQWGGLNPKDHISDNYLADSYWSSKDNYYRTAIYMSGVMEKFVFNLANYLNDYHNEKKNTDYWKIIAGEWALYFLWQVFNQWELLCKIIKNEECVFVIKKVMDKYRAPRFIDNHNFSNEDWNQLLFKDILDAMGKSNYEVIDYRIRKSETPRLNLGLLLKKFHRMAKKLKNLLSRESEKSCEGALIITNDMIGYFGVDADAVNCFPFKVVIYEYNTFISNNKPGRRRKILVRPVIKNTGILDEFESVLYKIAHNFIPCSLMEDRTEYLNLTQKLIRSGRPKAMCSSGIDYCDLWSYYLAALKEMGVLTYRYQHGGNYGIEKAFPFLSWEFDRFDIMLSWGRSYGNNTISSFYKKTLNMGDEPPECEIDVLVIAYEPLLYRLGYNGMPLVIDPKIYDTQITNAIQLLVRNGLTHIVYKTRDYGNDEYGISRRLSKNFTGIRIDKHTRAIELIKKSKLVIITYLSTAFFECLYENNPSVLYLNKEKDIIDEDIRHLFGEMEHVGLVHWDAVSLDKFTVLNKDTFHEWWTCNEVEDVKKKILKFFATPSENPFYDVLNLVYRHSQSGHMD